MQDTPEIVTNRPSAAHRGNGAEAPRPNTPETTTPGQVDRAAEKAHDLVDRTADKARELESRLREGSEATQEQLTEQKERAAEALDNTRQEVERFVRERPLASAGIAFAAGLIASRLLRR